MTSEQIDRMKMGWSREHLAQASGVSVAAIYLFERMGSAGSDDDERIRTTLVRGLAERARRNPHPVAFHISSPQNENEAVGPA